MYTKKFYKKSLYRINIRKSENYLYVNIDVYIYLFYTKIFTLPQKYTLKPSTYLLLSIPIKLSLYYYLL